LALLGQNLARAAFLLVKPSQRFWLLFSLPGGIELSVASTPIEITRLIRHRWTIWQTSARDEHPLYRMMAIKNDSLLI